MKINITLDEDETLTEEEIAQIRQAYYDNLNGGKYSVWRDLWHALPWMIIFVHTLWNLCH